MADTQQRTDIQLNQIPFKILSIRPIGIRKKVYPVETCMYCRGLLNELCAECIEKNSHLSNDVKNPSSDNNTQNLPVNNFVLDCEVQTVDDNYFHKHCFASVEKQQAQRDK